MLMTTIPAGSHRPVIETVQRTLATLPGLTLHHDPVAVESNRGTCRPLSKSHLHPAVLSHLAGHYPDGLFQHQHEAIEGVLSGRNMVVAYRLPRERLRLAAPTGEHAERLISRGVAPDLASLNAVYRRFVDEAEGHVRFEVLLIDYEQLLESEIGRSMHEGHVLDQRENQVYKGRLATNVEALMNWLFAYALSQCTTFDSLPIQMRGTYLPDYFDRIHRRLYDPPHGQHGLTM